MIVITTVIETTIVVDIAMAVIKAVAREIIDTIAVMPKLCISIFSCVSRFSVGYKIPIDVHIGSVAILIGSLKLPVLFPQTTVCTANRHTVMLSSCTLVNRCISASDSGVVGYSGAGATV